MSGVADRFADLPGAIWLCYQIHGEPGGKRPLLIAGLGQQLTRRVRSDQPTIPRGCGR